MIVPIYAYFLGLIINSYLASYYPFQMTLNLDYELYGYFILLVWLPHRKYQHQPHTLHLPATKWILMLSPDMSSFPYCEYHLGELLLSFSASWPDYLITSDFKREKNLWPDIFLSRNFPEKNWCQINEQLVNILVLNLKQNLDPRAKNGSCFSPHHHPPPRTTSGYLLCFLQPK